MTPTRTSPHAEEIVTGERLQALAETTLLPGAIALRLQGTKPTSRQTVRFTEHREISPEKLRLLSASRSLFVYTHALALFQEHVWPRLTGMGYVLITHGSDQEVGAEQFPWIEDAGGKLSRWFTQNLLAEHPKLSPLPIGIANRMWDHGDIEALISAAGERERTGQVSAQFDVATHPDRARAWQAVRAAFPGTAPSRPKPYPEYLAELAQHRFCVCPRGNGIDTHRFWECQYLGVVPVVERSPHVEMWAREGLPMVILDDWANLSPAQLENPQQSAPPQVLPDALCLSHYAQRVRSTADQARPT